MPLDEHIGCKFDVKFFFKSARVIYNRQLSHDYPCLKALGKMSVSELCCYKLIFPPLPVTYFIDPYI